MASSYPEATKESRGGKKQVGGADASGRREAHEISGKAAAAGAAVVALWPGTGFYLSRLPEAFRGHGEVCRGLPQPRSAVVLRLYRRRHRVVRRRASGAGGDYACGGAASGARHVRGDVEIQ